MSLLKLVPAWLHGIGDYGAGLALIIVPLIVGGTDEAVYTDVALGAVLIAVSLITRYPLGAVKALTNYQDLRVRVSDAAAEPTMGRREHRPRAVAAPRRTS